MTVLGRKEPPNELRGGESCPVRRSGGGLKQEAGGSRTVYLSGKKVRTTPSLAKPWSEKRSELSRRRNLCQGGGCNSTMGSRPSDGFLRTQPTSNVAASHSSCLKDLPNIYEKHPSSFRKCRTVSKGGAGAQQYPCTGAHSSILVPHGAGVCGRILVRPPYGRDRGSGRTLRSAPAAVTDTRSLRVRRLLRPGVG